MADIQSLLETLRLLEVDESLASEPVVEEVKKSTNYQEAIEDFLFSLGGDDVGVETIGPYTIHFEGFSDYCQQDAQDRCYLPKEDPRHLAKYEDIYDEVLRDFINREQGEWPIEHGLTGDDAYPVYYAIFQKEGIAETASTGQGGGSAGIGGGQMVGGPTTYEEEYDMFRSTGPYRITAMT